MVRIKPAQGVGVVLWAMVMSAEVGGIWVVSEATRFEEVRITVTRVSGMLQCSHLELVFGECVGLEVQDWKDRCYLQRLSEEKTCVAEGKGRGCALRETQVVPSGICVGLLFQVEVVLILLEVSRDSRNERMLRWNVKTRRVPDQCLAYAGGRRPVLRRLLMVAKAKRLECKVGTTG